MINDMTNRLGYYVPKLGEVKLVYLNMVKKEERLLTDFEISVVKPDTGIFWERLQIKAENKDITEISVALANNKDQISMDPQALPPEIKRGILRGVNDEVNYHLQEIGGDVIELSVG